MEKKYLGFEGLEVYHAARAFRIKVSRLAKSFPSHEKFTLTNQLLRSIRSVGTNIAEGYGRYHHLEFIQLCRIARGSLNKALKQLICAFDEGYITQTQMEDCRKDHGNVLRLLNGFIHYLNRQKESVTKPSTNTTKTTITTNTTTNA